MRTSELKTLLEENEVNPNMTMGYFMKLLAINPEADIETGFDFEKLERKLSRERFVSTA
ncbi:MAG: hypothetical protein HY881_21870 [Deltaproteobacteria bacterium]|nr:hypothetical protein [Deltaproteobacteria bacterium]